MVLVKGGTEINVNNLSVRKTASPKSTYFFSLLLLGFGFFMNHSRTLLGINFSISDFILVIFLSLLFLRNSLMIPSRALFFFLIVSLVTILTAGIITPARLGLSIEMNSILIGWIKLFVTFLYLLIGYNLTQRGHITTVLNSFTFGAIIIGLIGILVNIINLPFLYNRVMYGGIRLQGFSGDPNYFGALQSVATVYLISNELISKKVKIIGVLILLISVFLSGSKTNFLSLLVVLSLLLFRYFFNSSLNKNKIITQSIIILIILLGLFSIYQNYEQIIQLISSVPILNRILEPLFNFSNAINSAGSSRADAWETGFQIIKSSPILGVGIGVYSQVGIRFFNYELEAHNTYIQILAEWGMVLGLLFIVFLIYRFLKSNFSRDNLERTISYMLLIYLIGSLAISFNDSRFLWLIIGTLIAFSKN